MINKQNGSKMCDAGSWSFCNIMTTLRGNLQEQKSHNLEFNTGAICYSITASHITFSSSPTVNDLSSLIW
jgi:hypothetical protein